MHEIERRYFLSLLAAAIAPLDEELLLLLEEVPALPAVELDQEPARVAPRAHV
ncbi:MAG: hypothetical protein J0H57_16625 [Rhodospirillales bacterium]|nr:hypothetical protein [Rhodospirillales bacterium]